MDAASGGRLVVNHLWHITSSSLMRACHGVQGQGQRSKHTYICVHGQAPWSGMAWHGAAWSGMAAWDHMMYRSLLGATAQRSAARCSGLAPIVCTLWQGLMP